MSSEHGSISHSPLTPGFGSSTALSAALTPRFSVEGTAVLERVSRESIDDLVGSSKALMLHAAELIKSFLSQAGFETNVTVDESAGAFILRVRNAASGELIRQIPSQEALQVMRFLRNNTTLEPGLLVNRNA